MPGTTLRAHMYMMFCLVSVRKVVLVVKKKKKAHFVIKQLAHGQAGIKNEGSLLHCQTLKSVLSFHYINK